MYMRLVQIEVRNARNPQLRELYEQRIIPALRTFEGCRYAGLMQSVHHPEQCISLTLWDSHEHSEAYERGGVFEELMAEARPHLSESSEYRMQLSQDLTLEYVPVPMEPVVRSFPVAAQSERSDTVERRGSARCLRIVSLKILPGKLEEFKRLYAEHSIPALHGVKGCRYIYLLENGEQSRELFSVTSWDSLEDAENYERSGLYDDLLNVQKSTLSGLYQWKQSLGREEASRSATSEDVMAEEYTILIGEDFASPEGTANVR